MLIALWIAIGIMGRIVIHIPDVTPFTSLCLLSCTVFSKRQACFVTVITLLLSDIGLHLIDNYPIFGTWTLFNYAGWIGVTLLGSLLAKQNTFSRAMIFTGIASVSFWVWTNFGVWISDAFTLYPHTLAGLLQCYTAALPFLRNSLLGSLVWTCVLLGVTLFVTVPLPPRAPSTKEEGLLLF